MFRAATIFLCILAMIPQLACERDDRVARIEALCDSLDRPDIPGGFAVAVIQDGRVLFKKAYGDADVEHAIPFTTSTVFEFASVAKQFAGFALAVLARDGKLDLDDDIHTYLPELPDFGVDVLFSFPRGANGFVDRVVLSVAGEDGEPYQRVSKNPSDFVDVDAFLGDYDCPELETTYHVIVKNDRLVLEHLHNEDVLLQQMDRDTYRGNSWWCTEIRVTREAGDRVTGFKLSADNNCVEDLVFVKNAAGNESSITEN